MEQCRTSARAVRSLAVAGATGQQLVIGEPLATGQDRNAFMRVAGVAEWLVPPNPSIPVARSHSASILGHIFIGTRICQERDYHRAARLGQVSVAR